VLRGKMHEDMIAKGEVWQDNSHYLSAADRVGVHLRNMALMQYPLDKIKREIKARLQIKPSFENAYRLFMRPFGGLD
jgi:hypothetical protein